MAEDETAPRVYTLAEANAAIGWVAGRVERLRELRDEIRRTREFLDILWQRLEGGESVLGAIGERQAVLDALSQEFATLAGDLEAAGVVIRDLDPGLVDFPSKVRGIPIFLCWRAGEARIEFWHGIREGFAGRKPIAAIEEDAGPRPS